MSLNSILFVRTKYYSAWSVDCSWSLAAVVVAVVSFCPSTVALAVETSVARCPPRQAGVPPTESRRPRHPAPPRPRPARRSLPIELLDVGSILLCFVASSCCLVTRRSFALCPVESRRHARPAMHRRTPPPGPGRPPTASASSTTSSYYFLLLLPFVSVRHVLQRLPFSSVTVSSSPQDFFINSGRAARTSLNRHLFHTTYV